MKKQKEYYQDNNNVILIHSPVRFDLYQNITIIKAQYSLA